MTEYSQDDRCLQAYRRDNRFYGVKVNRVPNRAGTDFELVQLKLYSRWSTKIQTFKKSLTSYFLEKSVPVRGNDRTTGTSLPCCRDSESKEQIFYPVPTSTNPLIYSIIHILRIGSWSGFPPLSFRFTRSVSVGDGMRLWSSRRES